jgi:hypothetical protein
MKYCNILDMGQVLHKPPQKPKPQKEPVPISTPLFDPDDESCRSEPIDIPNSKPRIPRKPVPVPVYKYSFNNTSSLVVSFL